MHLYPTFTCLFYLCYAIYIYTKLYQTPLQRYINYFQLKATQSILPIPNIHLSIPPVMPFIYIHTQRYIKFINYFQLKATHSILPIPIIHLSISPVSCHLYTYEAISSTLTKIGISRHRSLSYQLLLKVNEGINRVLLSVSPSSRHRRKVKQTPGS